MRSILERKHVSIVTSLDKRGGRPSIIESFFLRFDLERATRDFFGDDYMLSILLSGEKRSKSLNTKYRAKDYVPDILSFPLAKEEGEIILTPSIIVKKYALARENSDEPILKLVIHGFLHLRHQKHGNIMDNEQAFYYSRYRHWYS